jgi:hypothetical protein
MKCNFETEEYPLALIYCWGKRPLGPTEKMKYQRAGIPLPKSWTLYKFKDDEQYKAFWWTRGFNLIERDGIAPVTIQDFLNRVGDYDEIDIQYPKAKDMTVGPQAIMDVEERKELNDKRPPIPDIPVEPVAAIPMQDADFQLRFNEAMRELREINVAAYAANAVNVDWNVYPADQPEPQPVDNF